MEYRFCPKCGSRLCSRDIGDEGPTPFCGRCNQPFFDFARPSVLVLARNDKNEVALLRQRYVSATNWVLVAGFNKRGETAEETVAREVGEETGLRVTKCQYISSYYHKGKKLLMLGFLAHVDGTLSSASSEVDEVQWVTFDQVPDLLREGSTGLAFYHDVKAILKRV
ncbi:MAG TPA: NUDIX domain-containing protein [Candidatus Hydrogenedentes bacterium]|nr:NUDIX domain-containing protein [Candidatus Hydrogenedentota bacterium]